MPPEQELHAKKMIILSRYESTLERGLFKALHELQRLQAARQGEAVPLPEAVDIDVNRHAILTP